MEFPQQPDEAGTRYPFYRLGNHGTEQLRNFPNITELSSGSTGIDTQPVRHQSLNCYTILVKNLLWLLYMCIYPHGNMLTIYYYMRKVAKEYTEYKPFRRKDKGAWSCRGWDVKSHVTETRWWRTWVTSAEPRLLHPPPTQRPPVRHAPSHEVSASLMKEKLHLTSSGYR